MSRFFRVPFAVSGNRTAVPDDADPYGYVSFTEGYGADYSANPGSDPDAKNIERDKWNSLMYDITDALRQYQTSSIPEFITSADNGGTAFSYAKDVRVLYEDSSVVYVYVSLVDSNTALPTDITKWAKEFALTEGNKVDVTVSSNGQTFTINNGVVTYAKIQNLSAQYKLLGRSSSGAGSVEEISSSADVFAMLAAANNAAIRTAIGLAIGTNVQAYSALLTSIAGLTTASDKMAYFTALNTAALTDLTAAGRSLLDDATVADMVNTLGGASSTGTGGLVRATSPTITTPTIAGASNFSGLITATAGINPNSSGGNVWANYVESTFTPIALGLSTGGSPTYATQQGVQTRNGREISVEIRLGITTIGGMLGQLALGGLTSSNTGGIATGAWASYWTNFSTITGAPFGQFQPGTTQIWMYKQTAGAATSLSASADISAASTLWINGKYNV